MKKIIILLNIFALSLMVACDPNGYSTFNDKDAFVAFDGANYTISEQGGSISIPVTLASVKGITTNVTVEGVDGTAKEGENYVLMNNGQLSFNESTRTAYVEIQIIDMPDVYTGDLKFTLIFSDLGGVNAGAAATANVTITDEDHPLSAILGSYAATTDSGRGDFSWTVTIEKDSDDVTKVWINDLDPYFASYGYVAAVGYNSFYGVVNADHTQIAVPCGQMVGYGNVAIVVCDENYDAVYSGNIIFDIDLETGTISIDGMWGIDEAGWWNYYANTVLVKE